ncbi:sulfurtransferase TusA family protein [Acidaminobacter sp. JC074]|uniref:sulfurtransferase TusA family protein n=1 Tax=Acidaminobacter sp. JC074 TaxID=2530199 RepID=UPI001F10708F|nr:sulfurtransferase TusA family protein [Acidaminobacter sp. JC074]MCH4888437.1 sulfurtransferase TusA family protein [Acidaminobacter sp. JC074]
MEKINCFGEICPVPLVRLQQQLKKMESGQSIMLVVDHSCVVESIDDYYSDSANSITIDEVINGVWEITVVKA